MSNPNKIIILIVITLMLAPLASNAQRFDEEDETSRWFIGGNIGLQIGYVTLIDVSPIVGYMLTERFAVGTGVSYKYYRIRNYFFDPYQNRYLHFRSHIYGGPVFARYYIGRQFFAHTEYEYLRFRNEVYVQNTAGQRYDKHYQHVNVHSMFVGGGFRQFFGSGSAFEIMLLWNLNETPDSPYNNPLIKMGVVIGL
jgi:hypothetical protein